jgi:hypothetical protein
MTTNYYPYRNPFPPPPRSPLASFQDVVLRMQMDLDRLKTDVYYLLNRDRAHARVVEERTNFEERCRGKINQLYSMVEELKKPSSSSPPPPTTTASVTEPQEQTGKVEKEEELQDVDKLLKACKMYECGIDLLSPSTNPFFVTLYFSEQEDFTGLLTHLAQVHKDEEHNMELKIVSDVTE